MAIDGLKNFLPPSQTSTTDLMDYKVYDAIRELQRKVQELTGYASGLEENLDNLLSDTEDLKSRVTALENQLNP